MLSSPFQQPSPRQNALAQQIQEARTSGDQALLAGLISQWVHRYGFDGAAELDLSLPEPSASKHEFSSAQMPLAEEEIAPEDDVLVENEVVAEDEMVVEEEEQIAAEDDVLIGGEVMQNGVVTEEETIVEEDESAAEESRFNAALRRHLCLPRRSAHPVRCGVGFPAGRMTLSPRRPEQHDSQP